MSVGPDGWFTVQELAGVRVHVLPAPQFKTLTAKVTVRVPLTSDGVTANALVPFVLRRGTRRLPTVQAIARALESMYGARLSVDVGKVGEVQLLEVRGEAVADRFLPGQTHGHEQLRALVRLLFEVLYDPALEQDAFVASYVAQEKDVLRRRIEGLINNKRQYAVHRLYEEMCRGEPFALHRLGRLDDLPAIEAATLFEHYRRHVVPRPAELALVGPVELDRVAELTASVVSSLPFRPRPVLPDPPPRQATASDGRPGAGLRQVAEAQDVRQEVLALGFRTEVDFRSTRYPALLMYSGVLGGFPHSKLFVNVRERHSLAYFVYSRLEPTKGIMVVSAGIDPSQRQKVLDVVDAQLADMAEGRIRDDELESTRRGTVRRLQVACDDPWALLDQWTVGMVNGYQRPASELIAEVERVRREDVVEAAAMVHRDTLYVLTGRPGSPSGERLAPSAGGAEGGVSVHGL